MLVSMTLRTQCSKGCTGIFLSILAVTSSWKTPLRASLISTVKPPGHKPKLAAREAKLAAKEANCTAKEAKWLAKGAKWTALLMGPYNPPASLEGLSPRAVASLLRGMAPRPNLIQQRRAGENAAFWHEFQLRGVQP